MICLQAILATGFGASERYFPTGTYVLPSQLWNKEKILASQIFLHFLLNFEMCQYSSVPLCQCAMWKEASKLASLKSWALKGVTVLQK